MQTTIEINEDLKAYSELITEMAQEYSEASYESLEYDNSDKAESCIRYWYSALSNLTDVDIYATGLKYFYQYYINSLLADIGMELSEVLENA